MTKPKPKTTIKRKKIETPAPETPETSEETVEEPVEETEETTDTEEGREEESAAKKAFGALIERYKRSNPTKYAQKEPELLAKLKEL